MLKKSLIFFVSGLLVHLYTTFILMLLWDWFVTIAFHVGEISFWLMYGLGLVVQVFQNPGDKQWDDDRRWGRMMIVADACVPDSLREYVKEQLEEHQSALWWEVGAALVGRTIGNTLTLGVAFVVHVLAS